MAQREVIIELDRQDIRVSLKIKIPKELEDYFKSISEPDTATSERWFMDKELTEKAKFYKHTSRFNELAEKLNTMGLYTYNDFGDGLLRNRQINLAPLRCVGVSDGINLFSENFAETGIDFEMYIRELAVAIKTIWREFISKKTIKAVITYDI